jgi:putative SOS response-associated peptidase YedK
MTTSVINQRPFAFAGLWDRWKAEDGTPIESFTITTTISNSLMEPLHDRCPAFWSVAPTEHGWNQAIPRVRLLIYCAPTHPKICTTGP